MAILRDFGAAGIVAGFNGRSADAFGRWWGGRERERVALFKECHI